MELDKKINTTKIKCSYLEEEIRNKDIIIAKCNKFKRKKIFLYLLIILSIIFMFSAIYTINYGIISIILFSLTGSGIILSSFMSKKLFDLMKKEFGTTNIRGLDKEEEKEKRKLLQKYEHEHMKLEEFIEEKRKSNTLSDKINNDSYIYVKKKNNIKVKKLVK